MADLVAEMSADRMTLTVRRRLPQGVHIATYHRRRDAGPFTDADVENILGSPAPAQMQPGQHNSTRRLATRYGTLWIHVMTGAPTWWLPRLRREKDGTTVAGWLRLALGVRAERLRQEASGD